LLELNRRTTKALDNKDCFWSAGSFQSGPSFHNLRPQPEEQQIGIGGHAEGAQLKHWQLLVRFEMVFL
jgi:hypothetical protein